MWIVLVSRAWQQEGFDRFLSSKLKNGFDMLGRIEEKVLVITPVCSFNIQPPVQFVG